MFSNIEVRFSNNRGKVLIKCLSSNILAACSKILLKFTIKGDRCSNIRWRFSNIQSESSNKHYHAFKIRTRFKNKKTGYGTLLFTIIGPGGIYIEQDEVLVTNGCSRSRSRCMW